MANQNKLKTYFDEYIIHCEECSNDSDIGSFLSYQKLPPYDENYNAEVLIIGHSPRVRTTSQGVINKTLDLNREGRLWKYITMEILSPLGITLKECAATNLVKCQTRKIMPEDIKIDGKRIFMNRIFEYCGKHLENEISLFKPKLLISLSERVAVLLQKRFSPGKNRFRMQEIFGTKRKLIVNDNDYLWIPAVHIPKPKVRSHYFPEQTDRLKILHDQIQELL